MSVILITGGTGMIGTRLSAFLAEKGHQVIILSRKLLNQSHPNISFAAWDPLNGSIDEDAIRRADHIVHLAGAGVADARWTKARKQEIAESRTRSSALLVKALQTIPNNVKSVISASAIGWYGPDTAASRRSGFIEDAPADSHFLGETCRLWESSIRPVAELGKRLVILRIGIVLSETGGAYPEFAKPLRFGIAAIAGTGEQVVSWIHVDDLCRIVDHAIANDQIRGIYNAVAPHPVTNKELVMQIGRKLRGSRFIPVHVPAFMLKIILGEMSVEVLKSATVSSQKLSREGFVFLYPTVKAALHLE